MEGFRYSTNLFYFSSLQCIWLLSFFSISYCILIRAFDCPSLFLCLIPCGSQMPCQQSWYLCCCCCFWIFNYSLRSDGMRCCWSDWLGFVFLLYSTLVCRGLFFIFCFIHKFSNPLTATAAVNRIVEGSRGEDLSTHRWMFRTMLETARLGVAVRTSLIPFKYRYLSRVYRGIRSFYWTTGSVGGSLFKGQEY